MTCNLCGHEEVAHLAEGVCNTRLSPGNGSFCDCEQFVPTPPRRRTWDEYFMAIADQVSTRGTCSRKHVGAVIVRDKNILSTGYNGSVPGAPHCDEVGHMMEDGHCVRTIHSEANSIIQAAKHGHSINEATIYTNASPCWPCFKLIAGAGIKRIVFKELYRDDRIFQFAKESGIGLLHLKIEDGTS